MSQEARVGVTLKQKLVRFPIVGAVNTLIYSVATWFFISALGMGERTAVIAGYCTALPLAYYAHRRFTFKSDGHLGAEAIRFGVVHLLGIGVSLASMQLVLHTLHGSYQAGILAGAVLVPIMSFVLQDLWVFRRR